jgi:MFS family permease
MNWLASLSRPQRSAILGASAGWGIDGFDFVLYSLVMPTLMAAWAMTPTEAGWIATSGLVTSSIGGWLGGVLADRLGRVRVLQLTVVWFSVCTALSGVSNSFGQLAAIRALQGLGFGGEWAVGAVLVAEMIGAKHRGKAVGIVQSSYAVGWALATVMFALFFSWLPERYAWRALFFVGVVPALFLIVYLRWKVVEPPVFLSVRAKSHSEKRISPLLEMFGRGCIRRTALASLLAIGIQGAYYSVVTWLPTYLQSVRHLSVGGTGENLLTLIFGSFLGYLVGAFAMDYVGRRKTFIAFALLSALTSYLYFAVPLPSAVVLLAAFPLGFTVSGMIGGLGAYLAELFPTRVRGSATGFTYNFGRIIAASFAPLIGFLSGTHALSTVMASFALGSFACVIAAALLLPETLGQRLEAEFAAGGATSDAREVYQLAEGAELPARKNKP